jgi:hypothetical protein
MYRPFLTRSTLVVLCGLITTPCFAIDYNEAVSGDLSSAGLTPTSLGALTLGSNEVFGATGDSGSGIDRDYFTFSIPVGFTLESLTVLPGTEPGERVSFIGIQEGSQVTVSPNASDATGLLGWTHYSAGEINTDILPIMSSPSFGSSGFTPPLGAGDYSIWIQDFDSGVSAYGFRFGVQPVPSPAAWSVFALGCLPVMHLLHRRR